MRGGIYLLLLVSLVRPASAQYEILRTKLTGTSVKADSAWRISGFRAEQDGEYVQLRIINQDGVLLGPIFRSRLAGIGVQSFTTTGDTLLGFTTEGPDTEGYVYLRAKMKNAGEQRIIRSKLEGCDVQAVQAPTGYWINKLRTKQNGEYIYLEAVPTIIGIEEQKSRDSEMELKGFVFALNDPAPNPFRNMTKITYSIANPCKVEIKVFDVCGRLVKTLINEESQKRDNYSIFWKGEDEQGSRLGSGVYFIKMEAGEFKANKKITILR